jgi:low affinity Fe/Cu permease
MHGRPGVRAESAFARFAARVADAAAHGVTFSVLVAVLVAWVAAGPFVDGAWHRTLGLAIGILTVLLLFLLHHVQRKQLRTLHRKVDELIGAHDRASNRLLDLESLDEHEVDALHARFARLARRAERVQHRRRTRTKRPQKGARKPPNGRAPG